MVTIRTEDLRRLFREDGRLRVSILMPTHQAGRETAQNPIRLKNLAKIAETRLIHHGMKRQHAQEMLSPIWDLIDTGFFFGGQKAGLALYLTDSAMYVYQTPEPCPELVRVGKRCYIKPLIEQLGAQTSFFVLALSRHSARLIHCTPDVTEGKHLVTPVARQHDQAASPDRPALQAHAVTPGRAHGRMVFHGQAAPEDDARQKSDTLHLFRKVDGIIGKHHKNARDLFVLAAVESLHPLYREVNTSVRLAPTGLMRNPEHDSPAALRDMAYPIVKRWQERWRKEDATRCRMLLNTKRGSADISTVLRAADEGRIQTLFVRKGAPFWGQFDTKTGKVRAAESTSKNAEGLLNRATAQAFLHGGTVYGVSDEEVPGTGLVAAILRY
jgi:hypothetical protein